ncbi:hypothetical protein V6N11_035721 [Hibiscus sabdariffa]|uniref:Uncharacterized protein n=1 Tax=Hibiscus sabdariffa TaxID=183260 RepID=A0ABR2R8A7_9ROSI
MRKVRFSGGMQVCDTRTEKEEMLQHFRKDAYTWTLEPAVSSREGTPMLAALIQHSGVQNGQKFRKDKEEGYFAAHMAFPCRNCPIREGNIPLFF